MSDAMPQSRMLIDGKRLLVTGAARGLGACFAEQAASLGASVVVADCDEVLGHATVARISEAGGEAHFVTLDLLEPGSIEQAVARSVELLGGLDGLVNNAAVTNSGGKRYDEIDVDVWNQVMDVNVRGSWLMTRAAVPHLRDSGAGRIVNLASDTALWGAPKLLAYVASKGAIIAMTRSLARELGDDNITVNAVAPGLVDCEATAYVPADRHQFYQQGRALSRHQVPADVAGVMAFLLSDAAAFVTGQLLPVNGGFVFN